MANANTLLEPGFAKDPPVKLNVNAKILGLVIGILAVIGAILSLLGLIAVFGACTIGGQTIGGCGLPVLWLLGSLIALIADVVAAIGGFRMYQLNRQGKEFAIYGIALAALGTVVYLIGNIIFYSGYTGLGVGYGGAVVGTIIDLIIFFIIYYLVVISRFPGDSPLVPQQQGGYGSPPPPPPPTV